MYGNEWQSDYYAGDQMNILTVVLSQDCNFPLLFLFLFWVNILEKEIK